MRRTIRFAFVLGLVLVATRVGAQEHPEHDAARELKEERQKKEQADLGQTQPGQTQPASQNVTADTYEPVSYSSSGGFQLKTRDENYTLRLGLQAGIKYEPVWTEGRPQDNGTLAFMRPSMRGRFYKPWLRYLLSVELAADTPFIIDANVEMTPWEEFGLVVGQQGTPVGRHLYIGVRNIFFPDFASVAGYFWAGREKGITLLGSVADGKVEYMAGIYNGAPLREVTSNPHNYVAEGRVTVSPMGPTNANEYPFTPEGKELPARVSFTGQGYHGKLQLTRENTDATNSPLDPQLTLLLQTMTVGGADLWLQWWRFIVYGEYFVRHVESTTQLPGYTAHGAWGQIVANVYKNLFGAGARFNWLEPNTSVGHDNVFEVEGQLAWFIKSPELVLKLRYAWLHQNSPDVATLGSFVLPFAAGTTNLATLQLNFVF